MFESSSRYAPLRTLTFSVTGPDGEPRDIRHVERRFIPAAAASVTLLEHRVAQGDRLDNLTAKYLGDPTQFWRVADANEEPRPEELTAEVGRTIRLALPQS
jgi:hypothetical protein